MDTPFARSAALAIACLLAMASSAPAWAAADDGPAPSSLAVCAACHGSLGEGAAQGVPRLAGQDAGYLSHALSMFKAGTRAGPVMQSIAAGLSDREIVDLGEYFSRQKPPLVKPETLPAPAAVLAGKVLAQAGTPETPACFSCHGAEGQGNGSRFPRIGGQPETFVINRLLAFQERARTSTPQPGTMTAVASTLDEAQIREAAAYLSSLEP